MKNRNHEHRKDPPKIDMGKTYRRLDAFCIAKGINGTARALAKEIIRLHAKEVNKALATGGKYPVLKTNNPALSKRVGGVDSTIYRNRQKLKKHRIIVEEKSYGPSKNYDLLIAPDFYHIYVKGDRNTALEIDKILTLPLRANCNPLVPVSSCLKGNLKGNIIDCNEQSDCRNDCKTGVQNEVQRTDNSQKKNLREPFEMETNQRHPPANAKVSHEELRRFSNQALRTIIDRLFDGNYYTAEQRRLLRTMIAKHLFEASDSKKEFGDILAGTKEAAGRNLTRGLKISDFFKDGGLTKLAEMGSALNSNSSTNPDSAISALADRMKING